MQLPPAGATGVQILTLYSHPGGTSHGELCPVSGSLGPEKWSSSRAVKVIMGLGHSSSGGKSEGTAGAG